MTLNTKEQISANNAYTIGTSSTEVLQSLNGTRFKRSQLILVNTSAALNITVMKGSNPVVASTGILLLPGGTYIEGTDGGFNCWQGSIQAISTAAGSTLSVIETKEAIDG